MFKVDFETCPFSMIKVLRHKTRLVEVIYSPAIKNSSIVDEHWYRNNNSLWLTLTHPSILIFFLVVTFVPASKLTGHVEVSDIIAALRPTTCLVTIMHANNETGIIQVRLKSSALFAKYLLRKKWHNYLGMTFLLFCYITWTQFQRAAEHKKAWNFFLDHDKNSTNQISTWFSGWANNSWIE